MLLMGALWARRTVHHRSPFTTLAGLAVVGGLLAYVPFLLFGYGTATIGNAQLPLATIIAALNMFVWYGFLVAYVRVTRGYSRPLWVRLWDAALGFMVFASLGAWGRALLVALDISDPFIESALVHLFLGLFSDGWFVLGLLGVMYALLDEESLSLPRKAAWASWTLILSLPLTFLLGVPLQLTPPFWRHLAGIAGIIVGISLLAHLQVLWPRVDPLWRVPMAFLALKAIGEIGVGIPPIARWAEDNALRVPYLHWLLLGFVTLGLIVAGEQVWRLGHRAWVKAWIGAVLLLQSTLIPLTGIWPSAWRGLWTIQWAAWTSTLIVGLALVYTLILWRDRHRGAISTTRSAPMRQPSRDASLPLTQGNRPLEKE